MSNKFEKLTIKDTDELMDIVRDISHSKEERILLSFPNDSEVLISPINLKVLSDIASQKGSALILQIFKNPTGLRNAQLSNVLAYDSPNPPTEDMWLEAQSKNLSLPQKIAESTAYTSSFEERINNALSKNKERGIEKKEAEIGDDIVFDQDIGTTQDDVIEGVQEDLTKVDFKQQPQVKKKGINILEKLNIKGLFKSDGGSKSRFVKLLPKIVIPGVAIFFLVGFIYYYFAPYVTINAQVESKEVSVERIFTGDSNIKEIDFEELKIPIKTESVKKSLSEAVQATGVAYKGEKATGSVTVHYINASDCTEEDAPITLNVGQKILNSTENKRYSLKDAITITCGGSPTAVAVEALEVGEEYNIASGKYFSVEGYQSSKVYGVNGQAFTGGSSTEYTVLSQKDVNDASKSLEGIATDDALRELKNIGGSWVLIESTIVAKVVEGSLKSDVSIGSEARTANVELEVEAVGTFYYNKNVEEELKNLLSTEAINQGLFDDDKGLELQLTEEIDLELTVEEGEDVKIKLVASSSVQPKVDRDNIINELRGMRWEEGNNYLKDLTFLSEEPVVVFTPEGYPKKLRYFPSRQGRISFSVN